ncbi:MAG: glycosyltransferase [Bacteroidetes bacterium]|nr:glycosyltransferase [Bacteroidota bacterium]
MKISICIPQYNRIAYLSESLSQIEKQDYKDIEVVVSDDCSTDDTEKLVKELQANYKYPLIYKRNEKNLGYDRNYRQCIELASGDYCILIGNDDTIYQPHSISFLVDFLIREDYPDLGFSNFVEDNNPAVVVERAQFTQVLGADKYTALKNYSCFSFVGGLIYKKSSFLEYNTDKHDGSVYAQMYLGCLMVSSGCRLFSIKEPLVLKDLQLGEVYRSSYRENIARKWKDFKVVDGGIPSVINVLISAFGDAGVLDQQIIKKIFLRIYTTTLPHWILDYKSNKAFPEAIGIVMGLNPLRNPQFLLLHFSNRVVVYIRYLLFSIIALLTPAFFFTKFKNRLYRFFKR